ncbi:MAG: hypothetical protein LBC52_05920 [Treponema sp.]|nr:hypothetical protein [Treponema sp.]
MTLTRRKGSSRIITGSVWTGARCLLN